MNDQYDPTEEMDEDFADSTAEKSSVKALHLAHKVARRVERGHLWVFSNEVAKETGDPQAGDEVAVFSPRHRLLGLALYSKSSLIRGRIYTRRRGQLLDAGLIRQRLEDALALRREVGGGTLPHSYRLVHSEADGLPGATIDVFGPVVVMQITTAGMERRRDWLIAAIERLLSPEAIIERSDVPARAHEGLAERSELVKGTLDGPVRIEENGIAVLADLLGGQKTGYYLDQVANRALVRPLFKGRRVLDLFCYVGAWSMAAAAGGAREVLGIDSSAPALALAEAGRDLNPAAEGVCRFEKADVFARLREIAEGKERYGMIILDPPPLAKSRRHAREALRGYRELNLRAMQALAPDGVLVTCCCSHAIDPEHFEQEVMLAAKDARRDFSVLACPAQPADHPRHLGTPETAYLKCLVLRSRPF